MVGWERENRPRTANILPQLRRIARYRTCCRWCPKSGGSTPNFGVIRSRAEALRRTGFCFRGFFLAILGRCGGFEGTQQSRRDSGYVVHRSEEQGFIRLRWLIEARDFADELERGGGDFVVGDGRIEVNKES